MMQQHLNEQGEQIGEPMPNETLVKFDYPDSLLREYENWVVLLRPDQITLGTLVLACKLDATAMGLVPASAFAELATVTAELENTLQSVFQYDKINYLLLMMVDPQVHFHVVPRYSSVRMLGSTAFVDPFWPGPPVIPQTLEISSEQQQQMLELLKDNWAVTA